MEPIGNVIDKHTIVVLNEALKRGFTQIPNYVLRDIVLSAGARLTFAMLLSYAWQEDSCFPGQERLAVDLGVSDRAVRKYLTELKERGYIDWKQQGLNKTNIYYILDFHPRQVKSEADRNQRSDQGRNKRAGQERNHRSDK